MSEGQYEGGKLSEPEWVVIPQDQCKQVGDAVSLICTVANIDVDDMEWTAIYPTRRPISVGQFINTPHCPSSCTIRVDESIGEYNLTIDPLESKDFGVWQCSAPTADPQAYTMYLSAPDTCNNVTISVNDYNLTESNIYTVHNGSYLNFICDPHGCQYPCVTTKWFNGTEEIKTSTESNELSLTVSEYDDGISITCSANVATDPPVEDMTVLHVLHQPRVFEILILVGSQPFTKGDKVELECSTNGNPDPIYEWQVGDEVLQDTDRILNIEFNNEVTVKCTATNPHGTDFDTIILKEKG
ncbi:cell adhesion molecule 1-like, partial [Saccoglossus kowalevskii]|uniref:Uncharacterized protein LOC102809764 n=1 Tax=Saccoglossus kowalevskii TaxID=10224 RepID=A0ABM0MDX7_SACKO